MTVGVRHTSTNAVLLKNHNVIRKVYNDSAVMTKTFLFSRQKPASVKVHTGDMGYGLYRSGPERPFHQKAITTFSKSPWPGQPHPLKANIFFFTGLTGETLQGKSGKLTFQS